MLEIIATLLAALAISNAGIDDKAYLRGFERHGEWAFGEEFTGVMWPCRKGGGQFKGGNDLCYAGLRLDDQRLVTGPIS